MKKLFYKLGQIEIEITVSDEDYDWVYALFTRNSRPFAALRDLGYMPIEKENETKD